MKQFFFYILGPKRIDLGPTYSHSTWEIRIT